MTAYQMPVLQVETGPAAGKRFPLYKDVITIGRLEDNDICLQDTLISKHHARVIAHQSAYLLEDLGSSNGTFVNGERITSHLLSDGDVVYLGDTTLTFWSGMGAVESVAGTPAKGMKKKNILVMVLSIAGFLVIAGLAVALILIFGAEKDEIKPEVKVISPPDGFNIELKLPVNSMTEVPIKVSASDDKGLDKIVIFINEQEEKTLKAINATKKSGAKGQWKSEEFEFKWGVNKEGDYLVRVKAFDWKGNTSDSDPVHLRAKEGPEIMICRDYVAKIDGLIAEFVAYRKKFQAAYTGAKNGTISYPEAGYVFNEVGNQRRDLFGRLNSISPPAPFVGAHTLFSQQISYAIKADDLAVLWARDMSIWESSGDYFDEPPDPNGYEKQMQSASAASQKKALEFRNEYNAQRAAQLNAGPGPDPAA